MANSQPIPSVTDDENTAAFVAAVQEGIDAANAGRTNPYEDVRRWVLSWGTANELQPPQRSS